MICLLSKNEMFSLNTCRKEVKIINSKSNTDWGSLIILFVRKKKIMEKIYGVGCANELQLFHGTKADIVDVICHQNFDFRLSGERIGTLFGKGTYFASTAKYSDGYATRGVNGNKVMFMAKCLVGKCTLGDPTCNRPPYIDTKDPTKGLYDCCVDNPSNPRIFCIFDWNQHYPEYVIQYT